MSLYSSGPTDGGGRRPWLVAGGFFVLSLVVLYLPGHLQGQLAAAVRASVLRPFLLTQESLARSRLRATDAARLEAQLDSLAEIVTRQSTLAEENRHLRELLGLSERLGPSFVPASVIRPGTAGSESMFLLDVGSSAGVREGAPVVMRDGHVGLVGVIREVREGTSIGIDWTHPDFRASAMTTDGKTYGIVEPRRGPFREEDRLLFNGTPFYTRLEPDTPVVTSGLGGVYPRGIPIGRVLSLAEAEAGWRKGYWLRSAVDPGNVTHVLVVVGRELPPGLQELLRSEGWMPPPGDTTPGSRGAGAGGRGSPGGEG